MARLRLTLHGLPGSTGKPPIYKIGHYASRQNTREAYREKVGLFFWCRQSGRKRRVARFARRQGRRAGGDDQNRSPRSRRFHDLHGNVRLLLQEREEVHNEVRKQVAENVAKLEKVTKKKLGDPKNPLLVSVRSGSARSMPGMMETILNLGLNDKSVEGLGAVHQERALRLRCVSPLRADVFDAW